MTSSIILTPIEIELRAFTPNFASISLEARKLYNVLCVRRPVLRIKLSIEMFEYYVTALLWARLLDIKHKNQFEKLSQTEYAYRAYFSQRFNVPYHIYQIFKTIGNVVSDGRPRMMFLADHPLPICVAGGKGGYHVERITAENHNLFEEVPSLGVIGDSLMASAIEWTQGWGYPNFPFLPSDRTKAAPTKLIGYYGPVMATEDVYRFLANIAISPQNFAETIPNTRFNINIIQYVSSILSEAPNVKRMSILEMGRVGSALQVIELFPTWTLYNFPRDIARSISWMEVHARPARNQIRNIQGINSANLLRFRLYKERMWNSHANWCCVEGLETNSWDIPIEWIENRNARRRCYNFYRPVYGITEPRIWETARRSLVRSLADERRQRRYVTSRDNRGQYPVPIIIAAG